MLYLRERVGRPQDARARRPDPAASRPDLPSSESRERLGVLVSVRVGGGKRLVRSLWAIAAVLALLLLAAYLFA